MTDTTATLVSPYAAAKLVNNELATRGVEKVLPPQMFYTYIKKQYIPSTNKKINVVDLMVWFEGYYKKLQGLKAQAEVVVEPDNDGTTGEWVEA